MHARACNVEVHIPFVLQAEVAAQATLILSFIRARKARHGISAGRGAGSNHNCGGLQVTARCSTEQAVVHRHLRA